MEHWEKTKKKISCFLIFHRIAVLWCCKAQSHSSFYLKTNMRFLWFISAKWKQSQTTQKRYQQPLNIVQNNKKKCIKLQLLNERHSFTAKLPNPRPEQQKPFKKVISVHDRLYGRHPPCQRCPIPRAGAERGFPPTVLGDLGARPLLREKPKAVRQLRSLTGRGDKPERAAGNKAYFAQASEQAVYFGLGRAAAVTWA